MCEAVNIIGNSAVTGMLPKRHLPDT